MDTVMAAWHYSDTLDLVKSHLRVHVIYPSHTDGTSRRKISQSRSLRTRTYPPTSSVLKHIKHRRRSFISGAWISIFEQGSMTCEGKKKEKSQTVRNGSKGLKRPQFAQAGTGVKRKAFRFNIFSLVPTPAANVTARISSSCKSVLEQAL